MYFQGFFTPAPIISGSKADQDWKKCGRDQSQSQDKTKTMTDKIKTKTKSLIKPKYPSLPEEIKTQTKIDDFQDHGLHKPRPKTKVIWTDSSLSYFVRSLV